MNSNFTPVSKSISAFIFDLDGIIVETTHYHYLSWKELAKSFGYDFQEEDNENLKGANRTTSLNILLDLAGISVSDQEKKRLRHQKNEIYQDLIKHMTPADTLPGVIRFIRDSKELGLRTALASSSENAIRTIERLKLTHLFDRMLDANTVAKGKPDPQIYLQIAADLGVGPFSAIVFEDAANGIEAAKKAGMHVVGMGSADQVKDADLIIKSFEDLDPKDIIDHFQRSAL